MVKIVINEQHTLLEDQKEKLVEKFGDFSLFKVPADGWDLEKMEEVQSVLVQTATHVVFASPIPVLLGRLAKDPSIVVHVLHNDRREKKELPNGKVISVVAEKGWQIVTL